MIIEIPINHPLNCKIVRKDEANLIPGIEWKSQ